MPPRRDNDPPTNPTEGINAEASGTAELPPALVFPHSKTGPPTPEQLYAMLQDLTRSIAILIDHQKVTQTRLDALTRTPAELNPSNPNLANPIANDQPQAQVERLLYLPRHLFYGPC